MKTEAVFLVLALALAGPTHATSLSNPGGVSYESKSLGLFADVRPTGPVMKDSMFSGTSGAFPRGDTTLALRGSTHAASPINPGGVSYESKSLGLFADVRPTGPVMKDSMFSGTSGAFPPGGPEIA